LFKYSNQFDNAIWQGTAVWTSGQADKDGGTSAWTFAKTNSSASDFYNDTTTNGVQTFSIYAKKQIGVGLKPYFFGSSNGYATFNLEDGSVYNTSGSIIIDTNVETYNSLWWRISVTINGSSGNWYLYVTDGTDTQTTDVITLQDAQLEIGLVATEYIESGATTGKAGLLENEPRFNYPIGGGSPHLLLEPSRTNLVTQSEYFGGYNNSNSTDEPNARTSPEGLGNATSFLEDETTGQHKLSTSASFDGSSTYTFSIFAKTNGRDLYIDTQNSNEWGGRAWFDLTNGTANAVLGTANIEDFGNGWYRCIVTGASTLAGGNFVELLTSDGSTNSTTGDITKGVFIYGAQLEEASYPTSYIPNHSGGSVSRESDIYQNTDIDTVTNMSTDECTIFFDVDLPQGREGSSRFLQFADLAGGGSTYFGLKGNYVPSPIIQLIGGGTISTSSTHSLSVGRHKIAIRWLSGTADVFIDGAEVSALSVTDSSAPTSFDWVYGSGAPYRHLVHQLIVLTSGWDDLDCRVLTGFTDYYASFSEMATALNYTIYE
jgi:hypothetical protein